MLDLQLTSPRSCYEPFQPPAPQEPEEQALEGFRPALKRQQKQSPTPLEHFELRLDDFVVYLDTERYPCEMRCLHQVHTKRGLGTFFFDGTLSNKGQGKTFVKRVPIRTVPIGHYGLQYHDVGDQIWLQSASCEGSDLFYKLGRPAKEYRRFLEQFVWVAGLAKHFVDFLVFMEQNQTRVTIRHFRNAFKDWLLAVHHEAPALAHWLAQHPSDDFRTSIVANIAFLYNEYKGVVRDGKAGYHDIWAEVWDFTKYPNHSTGSENSPTIVTDYVYRLFSHLPFGERLQSFPLSLKAAKLRDGITLQNGLELGCAPHGPASSSVGGSPPDLAFIVKPGDTISTRRDDQNSGSAWERECSNGFSDVDRWFALVQRVCERGDGGEYFEVLWYYRPLDTLCGLMKYPWNNELFLSDHCSCSEENKIQDYEVLGIHRVQFGGDSSTALEFFCRQMYLSKERKWVSLRDSDLSCPHISPPLQDPVSSRYRLGDTFLVHVDQASSTSEPCEVVDLYTQSGIICLCFRRLLRRQAIDAVAFASPCNELVYSSEFIECTTDRIVGKCHVRFFQHGANIPVPYNRDGVGSLFYITHHVSPDGSCVPLLAFPQSLRQGFDPEAAIPKLRGLDLFCGGGNLGRGLEEGCAITMSWANDHNCRAIHTYMANCRHPNLLSPFLGSIDDLHRKAFGGYFSKSVPMIGRVDFISGGSPCPGFSVLTNDRTTDEQRKNQSLVAAFASCVDLYRPKYGLLENVPGIVQNRANRDQDVFSQFMCAIVGLGYQAQMFYLDASSCGSAQRRSRVFISFAAPKYELPNKPEQTHSHPPGTKHTRLGKLPNGDALAERDFLKATPFPFVTARQVTSGLPSIYNGQTDTCIAFPDHRLPTGHTNHLKARIQLIPNRPWGMSLLKASQEVLTPAESSVFETKRRETSKAARSSPLERWSSAYGRLYPEQLFATVTTSQKLGDRKNGRQLHWHENRGLTVMEARRAQGFLDDEVILGTPTEQYKIVGNSVAREAAIALGLSIREAWAQSCVDIGDAEATASLSKSLERRPLQRRGVGKASRGNTVITSSPMADEPSRRPVIPQNRRRLTSFRKTRHI
ncbi:C-5 cytosine methyltransferase [Metarhizium rileyi]|uniref:DNA (cytosine-5-)-methyltransferase n=1 Tax=Metarhizium rileyi (strain RCEF 4871) TaxID=1649241 RepID=A0A167JP29_METRR|nr:C-5 cytosine methyltransferase [Metarhizium rileyi RCEF 4871]